ncbi:hypothetical protein DICSQDRAFT_175813 [Dichomitus squalens LYAD-421 SS1]|uniref:Uncharacterized protein n=1 Tax=Dichomitus squalens (strain LYAD-421) TaxID=732165 RepID=R7SH73_DICSQ|nr:uncharacterized protein DICSQDRAFT_175813 [Dichomitus squalens LYAD-421 SS1]EJF55514.1 hypothetical protein DICSQDRAFT_175813 [Dichomitus squalens LYAD-421 SS1]
MSYPLTCLMVTLRLILSRAESGHFPMKSTFKSKDFMLGARFAEALRLFHIDLFIQFAIEVGTPQIEAGDMPILECG